MKRKFDHPEPTASQLSGPKYWRSLDELAETPGFKEYVEREFPAGASELEGVDRRHFFKIMAASFGLGGLGMAGCRRPEINILPYAKSPEMVIPGVPLYFATAMPERGAAVPLIVETHQGRPTKIEGNPSFELNGGATTLRAQASVLDLYDPDRAAAHTRGEEAISAEAAQQVLADLGARHAANGGAGLAFLAEQSSSPTRARLVAELRRKLPRATWAVYEPVTDQMPVEVSRTLFGRAARPFYHFAKAKRVLAIDSDFLCGDPAGLAYARAFANARRVESPQDPMNRLYAVESNFTLTGGMADHRLRLATSHMVAFTAALASRLAGNSAGNLSALSAGLDLSSQWLDECAEDLRQHRGESIVIAGNHLPAVVHGLVAAINQALGNLGSTVEWMETGEEGAASIEEVAEAIRSGSVRTLVVLGGNPVYNAPADLDWAALQQSVPEVIRYGYHRDETSASAAYQIAATHYLESWGDARAIDGTVLPIQPMILPLFGGMTELEVLARIIGLPTADSYELVRETLSGLARGGSPEETLRAFLHDGLLAGSQYRRFTPSFQRGALSRLVGEAAAVSTPALSAQNLEVRFVGDYKVDDGRFANNGWLQECPDPMTKLTWDNAILVSPRLGKELGILPAGAGIQVARQKINEFERGVEAAPVAELLVNGRSVQGPVHIFPGLSNYTVILPLGYGRSASGRIGQGVGFSAYAVRQGRQASALGGILRLTGETYRLADTQEHWSMEGRDIIREANYDEYQHNPDFVEEVGMEAHSPPIYGEASDWALRRKVTETPAGNSLYDHPDYVGVHQWGMSIDLNTCTGCNACVVACQAENNIPIVGKEQVLRGREMHWLRLDRYYSSGSADNGEIPEDPQVSIQPMACVHCENAPCELVCPVNATVHDSEGLNVMAYNRCIGTRYCANNCPYKVRRFNFFDWHRRPRDSYYMGPLAPKGMPELLEMVQNPDVTVRMRGVMEKCTYCVQRIQQATIAQKVKAGASSNVVVPDGAVKTACQQACPSQSIVFGNILDPDSAVSKAKHQSRDYSVLAYLNTRPRTSYLGKLRNPNPKMPDFHSLPLSRVEYELKNHVPGHGGGHPGAPLDEGHGESRNGHGAAGAEPQSGGHH